MAPYVLLLYRLCDNTAAANVRDNAKDQTIDDYMRQFTNAQTAIDTQARAVGRAMLALDGAQIVSVQGPGTQHYQNGTWVQKGTVVITIGP